MKSTTVEMSGALDSEGQLRGKGKLTFSISDASKAGLSVDYSNPDSVKLCIDSSVGLKIRKSKKLTFTGAIGRDLTKGSYEGKVGLRLEIPKKVAVTLQQDFKKKGNKTTVSVTLRF